MRNNKKVYDIGLLFCSFIIYYFISSLSISPLFAQPGCPNVNAGNDQNLNCSTNCTNLTATFLHTGATSAYTVSSIPYAPPYSYSTGTPLMVNIDDTWSSVINLPFNFCFFGNNYTQIVVGSNGVITFNTSSAGGYCPWSYTASCPSSSLPLNSIFGPYHDIDPAVTGDLYYAILGSSPCRTFVINFNQVAMYSCTSLKATHQIVLYESTNVIEVYMQNKPLCSSWNSGNAVIGIQNSAGTVGYTAPGRNTSQWTASNEAWRFTPSGPANYVFVWLQGATQIGTTPTINVCPTQTTTYTAQVTYTSCDGTTDVLSDQVVVNRSQAPNISINPANINVCLGGSHSLTASGATSYTWSPPTGLSSTTGATVIASPSVTTTYTVSGTTNGCTGTATAVVNISGGPNVTLSPFSSVCVSAPSFALTGGSPTGGTYSGTGVSSNIFNPATAGNGPHTITYTYTDGQGCIGTATQPITVFSSAPADAGNNQIVCQGQSVNLTAYGGVTYLWSNNSQTQSINVTPSSSTTYTVTVTDNNGCSGTDNVNVTVNMPPNASAGNPVNICYGNSTPLNASGGTGYTWTPSNGLSGTNIPNPTASPIATTTYTVNVVDLNGCSATSSVIVSVKPLPIVNITGNNASCSGFNNASATANVTIGTSPFQFLWSTVPVQTTQTANNLHPQTNYTVTVTDVFGCTATSNITLSAPTPLTLSTVTTDAKCFGSNDGIANATVNGGTPPYTYTWLPAGTAGNVNSVNTLPHGTYTLQVTDNNNCLIDTVFTINQPSQITYTSSITNVSCNNGNNGSISLQVQGGIPPYGYNWSCSSASLPTVGNLVAGVYHVTVTDAHLCDTIITLTVTEPPAMVITPSPSDSFCIGQTYNIQATVTGGTLPYSYHWNNNLPSLQSHTLQAQSTTTYTVYATDTNNCTSPTANITIFVYPPLSLSLNASPSSICTGYSSTLQTSVTGGNGGPYNYHWSVTGTSPTVTVSPLQTTTYYLTVSDNCGTPPVNSQVIIHVFPSPTVNFTADKLSGCVPMLVNFTNSVVPVPASYHWDFGDPSSGISNNSSSPNPIHIFNDQGVFSVSLTVQSTDGCTANEVINNMITVYPLPFASFYSNPTEGTIEEPLISFVNTSIGSINWNWWFDDPASGVNNTSILENPTHLFTNSKLYQVMLIVETNHGCKDTTYRPLRIRDIFSIYIPNAFTPNGDGINDFFIPIFTGVQDFKMLIFNRWGEQVFETDNTSHPWDGKVKNGTEVAMLDVYSYVIVVKDVSGKDHHYIGHITLLKSDTY